MERNMYRPSRNTLKGWVKVGRKAQLHSTPLHSTPLHSTPLTWRVNECCVDDHKGRRRHGHLVHGCTMRCARKAEQELVDGTDSDDPLRIVNSPTNMMCNQPAHLGFAHHKARMCVRILAPQHNVPLMNPFVTSSTRHVARMPPCTRLKHVNHSPSSYIATSERLLQRLGLEMK